MLTKVENDVTIPNLMRCTVVWIHSNLVLRFTFIGLPTNSNVAQRPPPPLLSSSNEWKIEKPAVWIPGGRRGRRGEGVGKGGEGRWGRGISKAVALLLNGNLFDLWGGESIFCAARNTAIVKKKKRLLPYILYLLVQILFIRLAVLFLAMMDSILIHIPYLILTTITSLLFFYKFIKISCYILYVL